VTDRNDKGQFVKGNSGGPGRPKKEREEKFLEITQSACTYSDWRKIIKRAVEQAKRGDSRARKFLADYLLGPPRQRHELMGTLGNLDLASLSLIQLERLAAGDDPLKVLLMGTVSDTD